MRKSIHLIVICKDYRSINIIGAGVFVTDCISVASDNGIASVSNLQYDLHGAHDNIEKHLCGA